MFCNEIFTPQPLAKFCEEEERCKEWEGRNIEGENHKAKNGNGISGMY
jgi:hypothetical protein